MFVHGIMKPVGTGKRISSTQNSSNETNKTELLDVDHSQNLPMRLLSGQKRQFHGGQIGKIRKNEEIFEKADF